jgi:hypothetical protein
VTIYRRDGAAVDVDLSSKREVARAVLDEVESLME